MDVLVAIRSLSFTGDCMESSSSWPESLPSNRIKAIEELTKGQSLTNKLREMLGQPEKVKSELMSVDEVVAQILGMFDNTLTILTSTNAASDDIRSPSSWDDRKSEDSGESVKTTAVPLKPKRGCYKRRKNAAMVTKEISTLTDDGHAWRKYGQKAILNSKHQRNYYRCTHKFEQGCLATKQVQKTDDVPSKYRITYYGRHSCKNLSRATQIILDSANPSDNNSVLINFETNTTLVDNKQVGLFSSSVMKHIPNDRLPSLGIKQDQVSSSNDIPWDLDTQVPSEPMSSMMSSELDHEDMVSSGHGYGIDDFLGSNDFGEFPFELCYS